jgi:hypothetical protein
MKRKIFAAIITYFLISCNEYDNSEVHPVPAVKIENNFIKSNAEIVY